MSRLCYQTIVVVGLALTVAGCAPAHREAVTFVEGPARCAVNVVAEPAVGDWQTTGDLAPGAEARSTGGYRLSLQRRERNGHAWWEVKLTRGDGETFRVTEYTYACRTSLGRVAAVFSTQVPEGPSIFRQSPQIDAVLQVRPNRSIPFLMACDHYGNNSMAVGPTDQTGTYRITGRRDGDDYSITAERKEYEGDGWFTGTELTDALFVSVKGDFWFDTARAYADAVDALTGYTPRPIPATAYRPYYSTWYAFGSKIDTQTVWDNAVLAREMGIGNFLIFIGWSECENWFSSDNKWGDYTPCQARFPDFAKLVGRIQDELGMAVQLWVAPTWIGANSESFARMKDYRSKWPGGNQRPAVYSRNLDPRSPAAREHIRERFALMARELGVDGFWVDYLDTLWNRNDAPHEKSPAHFGSALGEFMGACYTGFGAERPEPLVEYRIPFANLLSKPHASVFGTTYTDGRWDRNRLLAVAHRPFNQGVVSKCDPLVWTKKDFEDRDFVGKSLSAVMMCGPPGISMDLTKMEEDRRENLKAWLAFYEKHRENLVEGEFRPFGEQYHCPEMMVHRGDTAYAWVSRWATGHIPFPQGTRHAFIFTALPKDESFIARVDITQVTGLVPGRYIARRFNSTLESHDAPMEIVIKARTPADLAAQPLRSPRENWDWAPDDEHPSLDVARGGFWELELKQGAH